jgi:transcription antitermination factor NusG
MSPSSSPALPQSGDRVRIGDGTLAGQEGRVLSLRERYRVVVVEITLFGKPAPVELETWQVEVLN